MSLMLGIVAASGAVVNDYAWIATQEVTSSTSTITFSNIPSTYRALELRASIRQTTSFIFSPPEVYMQFNSDTGNNYSTHAMNASAAFYTNGTSAGSTNKFRIAYTPNAAAASEHYGSALVHIAGNSNPLTMTSFRSLYGNPADSRVGQMTGQWSSTSTVTSITLTCSYSFDVGSIVSLHGYKV